MEPLTSTTTTFGLTAATALRAASWLAGRSMWVRSKPSDSSAPGSPITMTTVSADPATCSASASRASSSAVSPMPYPAANGTSP